MLKNININMYISQQAIVHGMIIFLKNLLWKQHVDL